MSSHNIGSISERQYSAAIIASQSLQNIKEEKNDKSNMPFHSNPQQPSSSIGVASQFPMSGRQAIIQFPTILTEYEKMEIL